MAAHNSKGVRITAVVYVLDGRAVAQDIGSVIHIIGFVAIKCKTRKSLGFVSGFGACVSISVNRHIIGMAIVCYVLKPVDN